MQSYSTEGFTPKVTAPHDSRRLILVRVPRQMRLIPNAMWEVAVSRSTG